ncbi:MAG TPA: hypothetical protein VN918_11970 [Myxococcaceae bacterium]|nr:hypothetical protein [Myxococcaceae bacterium]
MKACRNPGKMEPLGTAEAEPTLSHRSLEGAIGRRSRENPQKFLSNALRFPYDDAHSLV